MWIDAAIIQQGSKTLTAELLERNNKVIDSNNVELTMALGEDRWTSTDGRCTVGKFGDIRNKNYRQLDCGFAC